MEQRDRPQEKSYASSRPGRSLPAGPVAPRAAAGQAFLERQQAGPAQLRARSRAYGAGCALLLLEVPALALRSHERRISSSCSCSVGAPGSMPRGVAGAPGAGQWLAEGAPVLLPECFLYGRILGSTLPLKHLI